MFYTIYQSKFCPIVLVGDDKGLQQLHLDSGESKDFIIQDDWIEDEEFFAEVITQINEYFAGFRKSFDVRLNPEGTYYQKKIWHLLQKIPYGKVYSYKDIAELSGDPNGSRAVGMANSKNPIPLMIPCHRVIGANKQLTGFAYGVELKAKLLELEGFSVEERLK